MCMASFLHSALRSPDTEFEAGQGEPVSGTSERSGLPPGKLEDSGDESTQR